MLAKDAKNLYSTTDHKPNNPKERERIEKTGVKITQ